MQFKTTASALKVFIADALMLSKKADNRFFAKQGLFTLQPIDGMGQAKLLIAVTDQEGTVNTVTLFVASDAAETWQGVLNLSLLMDYLSTADNGGEVSATLEIGKTTVTKTFERAEVDGIIESYPVEKSTKQPDQLRLEGGDFRVWNEVTEPDFFIESKVTPVEFPTDAPVFSLYAGEFKTALDRALSAAATVDNRPSLHAVLYRGDKFDSAKLQFAGADGYRLHTTSCSVETAAAIEAGLLPYGAVDYLLRILPSSSTIPVEFARVETVENAMQWDKETKQMVTVNVSVTDLYIRFAVYCLKVRLVAGKFPDFQPIVDGAKADEGFRVDRAALLKALKKISAYMRDTALGSVLFKLSTVEPGEGKGCLTILAGGNGDGRGKIEADVLVTDVNMPEQGWRVSLNSDYLLDALRKSDTNQVQITGKPSRWSDKISHGVQYPEGSVQSPVMVKPVGAEGDDFQAVIMPLTIHD